MILFYVVAHARAEAGLGYLRRGDRNARGNLSFKQQKSFKTVNLNPNSNKIIMKFISLAIALSTTAIVSAQTACTATSAIPTCGVCPPLLHVHFRRFSRTKLTT
jgi:hypothetical protein